MALRHAARIRLAAAKVPRSHRAQPAVTRGARDAGDHRLPPADHASGDPGHPRRQLLERAEDALREEADHDRGQEARRRDAVLLPDDAGLPRAVRPQRAHGAAQARRPRLRPRRHRRGPRDRGAHGRGAVHPDRIRRRGFRRGRGNRRGNRRGRRSGAEAEPGDRRSRKSPRAETDPGRDPDPEDHRLLRRRLAAPGGGVDPRGPRARQREGGDPRSSARTPRGTRSRSTTSASVRRPGRRPTSCSTSRRASSRRSRTPRAATRCSTFFRPGSARASSPSDASTS